MIISVVVIASVLVWWGGLYRGLITIEHAIYMHNLDKNNDKIPLTDNKYEVKVFYKGQELLLKEYLEELFPEDKQSLEKAKITVQSIRNGYQTLNTRNVAEIILGKQNGKDYLRSDQRFVFGKIQERINEKDKTIDIIYGVYNGLRERFRHYTWRCSNR